MSSRLGYAVIALLSAWTCSLLYVQFFPSASIGSLSLFHETHAKDKYRNIRPKEIRKNVWSELSAVEAEGLRVWLHQPEQGLRLTPAANGTGETDWIQLFEIIRPNKTDVIPYLDHGSSEPPRYARVAIFHGSKLDETSTIDEYIVGPLPVSEQTTVEPLTYIYNSGRHRTPTRLASYLIFREWMKEFSLEIYDIAHDLFNFTIGPDGIPNFQLGSIDPFWMEDDRDVVWLGFYQDSAARSLLHQALYLKADVTGRNASEWKVLQWLYNGILYDDLESLKTAWRSPGFVKLPPNLDGDWTEIRPMSNPTGELPPPPKLKQSGPSRVFIDKSENFVSWLNFTFTIGFSQITAMTLFDIRIDGERIMYELGFQEAMAHYAGDDPKMSGTTYLDSSFSFGALLSELVPGYDCPEYADYLSTQFHKQEQLYERKNTICIFEKPMDYPLQRHTDHSYTASFTSTTLVVRSIATIGNYDYLIDYIFYVDGSIEVKVRASGYIQGAYALHNQLYGYKVHDALSTAMHDHVINFKADLDIGHSIPNSFQIVDITSREITYPWSNKPRRTMVLDARNLTSESQTSLLWPPNSAGMYLISSPESNAWGELRSYRILPGTGIGTPPHLTMRDSSNLQESARWSEHDIYVTRQHDTEPMSCSYLNGMTPGDPLVRFRDFLADNETLDNEDLVLWFNLGSHHVPNSGDIPNTVMIGSSSSVIFQPFNFFNRDRGIEWSRGVTIEHPEGDGVRWVPTADPPTSSTTSEINGRGPGYWERIPASNSDDHSDLRVRKSNTEENKCSSKSQQKIAFHGTPLTEEEQEEKHAGVKVMEGLRAFRGLRAGRMWGYMPIFRDLEIF